MPPFMYKINFSFIKNAYPVPTRKRKNIFLFSLSQRDPIERSREDPVADYLLLAIVFLWHQLVALLSVATTMSELKVCDVRRVSTLCHRDDVVDRCAEGVGGFQTEVHRLPTDRTNRLRCEYSFSILLKLSPMWGVLVWSVCHNFLQHKRPEVLTLGLLRTVERRLSNERKTKRCQCHDRHQS